jgi:predicted RNase H-like nuclease (RuvC/YqgF family)
VIELTDKVDNLSAEVSELNQRMQSVSAARREAVKLRTEIAGMDSGLAEMASRLERADMRKLSDLKIKVLSGDNSLPSAKKAASKLKKNGYTVKRVDMAPSSKFSGNLVFYSKGMKREAEAIAKLFGGNTRTKPLSWPSVFDIIFVTGKG